MSSGPPRRPSAHRSCRRITTQCGRALNRTHDPALESWVESANDPAGDFPIQNLPFGRFRREADSAWCIGVAIGDQVLDLRKAGLIDSAEINRLIRLNAEARQCL